MGGVRGCRPGQSYNQHLFEALSGGRSCKKHTQAFSEGRNEDGVLLHAAAETRGSSYRSSSLDHFLKGYTFPNFLDEGAVRWRGKQLPL